MSNIVIKNLNIENIQLRENRNIINIKYNLKYYKLLGISYLLDNFNIKYINHNYYLFINDINIINKLNEINNFLKNKIKKYESFINNNKIKLTNNNYIHDFFSNKQDKCILHLKYIKNNYVIIHLN